MHEASVGELGVFESEVPEFGKALQVYQPSISDLSVAEIEISKFDQPLYAREADVGEFETPLRTIIS